MKWHGVSVCSSDFKFTLPRLYANSEWKYGTFYIYDNGEWKMVGGACTQMIPLIESGNGQVENNEVIFQVREPFGSENFLLDTSGNYLRDSNSALLHTSQ